MANMNVTNSSDRDRNGREKQLFNRVMCKKISAMLSLMIIIAIMVPVLAFAAAGFSGMTYKDGTVSGTVYSNTYLNEGNKDAVWVNLFTPKKDYITSTKAVYSNAKDSNGNYLYKWDLTNIASYDYLTVQSVVYYGDVVSTDVTDSVYSAVYKDPNTTTPSRSRNGGGGFFGGSVNGSNISVSADGFISAYSLSTALASGNVTLKLVGDYASIPASALVDAAGKTITIINDNGTLVLPISVLNLAELAKATDVDVQSLIIKVSIAKADTATAAAVTAAAAATGGTQVSEAVDFKVVAVGMGSKTVDVDFGKTYVSRSVKVSKSVDPSKATGVLYNETTKKVSFVPTVLSTEDGNTVATMKRNGNSIYTVIESNKSFPDVASHWSKTDVELLANKLVVDGTSDKTFEPDRNINRAEFAALVVRSLGLTSVTTASNFKDVKSDAWYASTVATATYAGIINGYEDNTFRPDAQITREELAAMVVRAMSYADISANVTDPKSVLNKFKDADKIVWAQQEIANAINAGIINGLTDTTIGSSEQATRAQAATMLKRFLGVAKFIN